MILNGSTVPVETSANVTSRSFKILASRKAFEILSSGLYANKIQAVVRELGTNAADAHVAAGTVEPFKVQLPNSLFPYFEVKDYGTGLSESDVLNLYTTYFDSNKTGSNAFTGCLGLGSKSPFSYTDSFTVESRFNGTLTTYTAYLDADGIPAVSKLGEVPTEEVNGLTVRIPVEAKDFGAFKVNSVNVYQWFSSRPRLVGGEDTEIEWPKFTTVFDGADYSIGRKTADDTTWGEFSPSVLVMGNVAYPINNHPGELRKYSDLGIVLYANIGDVEMTAGREELSYDAKTVEYLKQRGQQLQDNLVNHVTKHIEDATHVWEARTRLFKLKRLLKTLNVHGTWRGQELEPWVGIPAGPVGGTFVADVIRYSWEESRRRRTYDITRKPHVFSANGRIEADDSEVWLVDTRTWRNDLTRVLRQRQSVYVIEQVLDPTFLTASGLDVVVKRTSTIPQAPSEVREKAPKTPRARVYEFTPGCGDAGATKAAGYWTRVTAPTSGVYVLIDRFIPAELTVDRLQSIQSKLETLGFATPIYGTRAGDVGKLGKSWKTLNRRIEEVVAKRAAEYDERIRTHNYVIGHHYIPDVVKAFKDKTKQVDGLRKRHPLRLVVEAVKAGLSIKESAAIKAYKYLKCYVPSTVEDTTVCKAETLANNLLETYPLLKWIGHDSRQPYYDQVLAYIALVDSTNR